jgi:hypothetical protein
MEVLMKKNRMNSKVIVASLAMILTLLAASACGPKPATEVPTQDPLLIQTMVVETAQAAVVQTLTQMALSIPSNTPPFFTDTPAFTASPLPSATSSKPMISVSMETLCRLGPGVVFDRVGSLPVGVFAEVVGVDPSHAYYFIRNPSQPESYCWVWGFYATTVNNFTGVPILTPAFTPTLVLTATRTNTPTVTGTTTPVVNFTITNPAIRDCNGEKFLDVTITNTGNTIFRSGSVAVSAANSGSSVPENASNVFEDKLGCAIKYSQSDLAPKEVGNLNSAAISFDIAGDTLTISVKVCPEDNLAGTCSAKSITFKP